jgi:RNA polymerase sigma factor (sigma-70 family)
MWQNDVDIPLCNSMSRERLYLDHAEAIEEVLRFTSRRHRCGSDEAEDFASWARLKLVEDDYRILASFEGRSQMRTFLRIVVQRLFLDYRRAKWGRWRPSEEAKRMGPLAVSVEALLWRDGMALEEACQRLQAVDPDLSRQEVEKIAGRLPLRKAQPSEEKYDVLTVQSQAPTPEAEILENETEAARRRATAALPRLLQRLPPQDQLILRLRFAEGMQIVDIAARLHLEAKPLYRRLEQLKVELRRALEVRGFAAEGLGWPTTASTPHRRGGASNGSPFVGETRPRGRLGTLGEEP